MISELLRSADAFASEHLLNTQFTTLKNMSSSDMHKTHKIKMTELETFSHFKMTFHSTVMTAHLHRLVHG